jgi:hypothetical protein
MSNESREHLSYPLEGGEEPVEDLIENETSTKERDEEEERRIEEANRSLEEAAVQAEIKEAEETPIEELKARAELAKVYEGNSEITYQEAADHDMRTALSEAFDSLGEKDKEKYGNPDGFYEHMNNNIREVTSDNNGENGIVVSKEAFCELLRQGYKPQDLKIAGALDALGYATRRFGVGAIKDIATGGELISIPDKNGNKVMTFEKIKNLFEEADIGFKQRVEKKVEQERAETVEVASELGQEEMDKLNKELDESGTTMREFLYDAFDVAHDINGDLNTDASKIAKFVTEYGEPTSKERIIEMGKGMYNGMLEEKKKKQNSLLYLFIKFWEDLKKAA